MKVVRNAITQKDEAFPMRIKCEYCNSELEIEKQDISAGYLGMYKVKCPVCGLYTYVDEIEEYKVTKDTVIFPDHFYHFGESEGALLLTPKDIRGYISDGIDYFRENPDSFVYNVSTGDSDITVYNYSGDEEYRITVAKNFYETNIGYEREDYDAQESNNWEWKNKGVRYRNGKKE